MRHTDQRMVKNIAVTNYGNPVNKLELCSLQVSTCPSIKMLGITLYVHYCTSKGRIGNACRDGNAFFATFFILETP